MPINNPLEKGVGIGLRTPHYQHVLEHNTLVNWFEVHSENFFYPDQGLDTLLRVRQKHPISLHGIGLSLGSYQGVEERHLKRLKQLIKTVEPFLISDHLSWNKVDHFLPDLFPIPYNTESFDIFKRNLEYTQDYLKKNLMIENPSSYIEYVNKDRSEVEFMVQLCKTTGAKLLLDINNVYVSCWNHQWDATNYILSIPEDLVGEMHLAGHSSKLLKDNSVLKIDSHDNKIADEVWSLYKIAAKRFKNCPTLIEWDSNIPEFSVLEAEANKACQYVKA